MAETVPAQADIDSDETLLPARIRLFRAVVDEAAQWYAGGLPPEPWAA